MKKIYNYKQYQALEAINEAIDELIDQVDTEEATKIQDLMSQQEEIYKKYDLSSQEIDNIKSGVEDSISKKFGIDYEM